MSLSLRMPSRRTTLALGLTAALSAGVTTAMTGSAEAVPVIARSCASNVVSTLSQNGWTSMGLVATVKNGAQSRQVIAQLSSDAGVDPNAELRVGYSVDGGTIREGAFGPANFANHTDFWETRTTMAVIPVSAGTHTVQAYWRVSGATGANGVVASRCFTVESRTS